MKDELHCARQVARCVQAKVGPGPVHITPMLHVAEPPDLASLIEPITEERASRTLYRIELLRKIREQVLHHPQLSDRLKLCQPSLDLPEWWECGRHDRDLLVGAAKHGVSRTDYHILNDPELSFLDAHKSFAQNRGASTVPPLNTLAMGHLWLLFSTCGFLA